MTGRHRRQKRACTGRISLIRRRSRICHPNFPSRQTRRRRELLGSLPLVAHVVLSPSHITRSGRSAYWISTTGAARVPLIEVLLPCVVAVVAAVSVRVASLGGVATLRSS